MAQPSSTNPPLIKPSQIDGLPHLSAQSKAHYKQGLIPLWQTMSSNPPGSEEHKAAELKIRDASVRIMQQISSGNRPNSGGQPQQQPGGQQQQRPPGQQQQAGQAAAPQAAGMVQQGSQQGGLPQQGQPSSLPAAHTAELRGITVHVPPQVLQSGQNANAYKQGWYKKAASLLQRRDAVKNRGLQLQNQARNGQGNDAELQKCKQEMVQAIQDWDNMKKANASFDPANAMQRQQGAQGMNQQQSQQQQQQVNGMQGDVKMQMDAGSAQSPQTQQYQGQPQMQNAQNQAQQTPQTATQPQPQQNFPQQQQHPNQQQRPPPLNAQQMQQAQQSMMQQQRQQQANSAMSQNAAQQQQQRPQPLTHQAAMSQAAESYSRQQAENQQQQQQGVQMPQAPNGLPLNANPPQSATQHTPTSAYPMQPQGSNASATSKFPIPKTLQLDPRQHQPVQGQPSRPTYANPGMLSQPGIQRAAQFTLEGEGDRVLSKRKLDELVRQVTGTVTASSDSDDANILAPDVEEAVLTLADDFVDNVITAACRLAKLRSSQTLDMRDIQMVLERNYGIRIPGYGLDEVRTVRKFQPAAGWNTKMQAVQAGKVMGGVGNREG